MSQPPADLSDTRSPSELIALAVKFKLPHRTLVQAALACVRAAAPYAGWGPNDTSESTNRLISEVQDWLDGKLLVQKMGTPGYYRLDISYVLLAANQTHCAVREPEYGRYVIEAAQSAEHAIAPCVWNRNREVMDQFAAEVRRILGPELTAELL